MIVSDGFSVYDHRTVRMFDPDSKELTRRPLHEGDVAPMWTYLDWMMSPSSNSAAGMLQKHLILLSHYGSDYPVSLDEERRFFSDTPRKQLSEISPMQSKRQSPAMVSTSNGSLREVFLHAVASNVSTAHRATRQHAR